MDKKKILFAGLFVAIMLLVPFTAVGTQPIGNIGGRENKQILKKESEQNNKDPEYTGILRCWFLRYTIFVLFMECLGIPTSCYDCHEKIEEIRKDMKEMGCIVIIR